MADTSPPDDTLVERLQSANQRLAQDNANLLEKIDSLQWRLNATIVDLLRAERHIHDMTRELDRAEKNLNSVKTRAVAYKR